MNGLERQEQETRHKNDSSIYAIYYNGEVSPRF
jgi:hypothetical protein